MSDARHSNRDPREDSTQLAARKSHGSGWFAPAIPRSNAERLDVVGRLAGQQLPPAGVCSRHRWPPYFRQTIRRQAAMVELDRILPASLVHGADLAFDTTFQPRACLE